MNRNRCIACTGVLVKYEYELFGHFLRASLIPAGWQAFPYRRLRTGVKIVRRVLPSILGRRAPTA